VAAKIGVVVIGRNEGERLRRCLRSIDAERSTTVYVDSGSADGSVEFARGLGVEVVNLDAERPFTMARARDAGLARLLEVAPDAELVQFVDGDCELRTGWLADARALLEARADVAVVCGRRRERHPEASRYNRLIDLEWDGPTGEVEACGGDAMFRVAVLRALGGYAEEMIAGEEPELCYRIRRAGFRVLRLPREMTLHDAAVYRFGQWWRRTLRSGHAFAECAWRHGHEPERFRVRRVASAVCFAGVLPAVGLLALPVSKLPALAVGLVWLVQGVRVYRGRRRRGDAARDAAAYAFACWLGRFAELQGIARFGFRRLLLGRAPALIEYKAGGEAPGPPAG